MSRSGFVLRLKTLVFCRLLKNNLTVIRPVVGHEFNFRTVLGFQILVDEHTAVWDLHDQICSF